MAATPGKKVKQGIETYLQTSQNLQQAKDQPLTDPMANIAKNVTIQTQQAAGQASKARDKVAEQTDPGRLGETVKVDQAAYAPPTQPQPKSFGLQGSQPQTSVQGAVNTQLGQGLQGFFNLPDAYSSAVTARGNEVSGQAADLRTTAGTQANAIQAAKEGELAGIEKALREGTGRITDAQGNIIGSNVSLGQVAPQSTLETEALNRQAKLAAQDPRSNIDALASLFGINYDPRLAGLSSQVYGKDIAQVRGEAAQRTGEQQAAEKGRASAMERYLGQLKTGQENVGKAREELGKNIDTFKKDAERQIKDIETEGGRAASQDADFARRSIINKGTELAGAASDAGYAAIRSGDTKALNQALSDLKGIKETLTKLGLPSTHLDSIIDKLGKESTKKTQAKQPASAKLPPIEADSGLWTN